MEETGDLQGNSKMSLLSYNYRKDCMWKILEEWSTEDDDVTICRPKQMDKLSELDGTTTVKEEPLVCRFPVKAKLVLPEYEKWKLQRNPFEREMEMFDYCARKGINPKFVNPCTMRIELDPDDQFFQQPRPQQEPEREPEQAVEQTASFSVLRLLLGNDDRSFDIAKHILPHQDPCSIVDFW